MAKIKKCLDKFGDEFSPKEKETMLDSYEKLNKTEDDLMASSKAALSLYKKLFNQLNSLKAKLGLKKDEEVSFPDTKEIVSKINLKYEELEELDVEPKKEVSPEKIEEQKFINKIRTMSDAYNEMTKAERKSQDGRDLYNRIAELAKEKNLQIFLSEGRIILKREDGTRIVRVGGRRAFEDIAKEKEQKEKYKEALKANPVDITMALYQAIANGMRFNINQLKAIMSSKDIARTSPFLKAEKKGAGVIDLEQLPLFLKEMGGPEIPDMDAPQMWSDSSELINDFVGVTDFRQQALDSLLEYYEDSKADNRKRDYNQGMSDAQIKYLEERQRLLEEDIERDDVARGMSEQEAREAFEKEFDGVQQQKKSSEAQVKKQIEDTIKKIFNISGEEAKQSASVIDSIVDTMAERAGISKTEMYKKINFQKAKLEGLPGGVKMQVDAWHGSPYEFDKFSTEKMGTGEGAQAFGWGLYFTSLEGIARGYAEALGGSTITFDGVDVNDTKGSNKGKESISILASLIDGYGFIRSTSAVKNLAEKTKKEYLPYLASDKLHPDDKIQYQEYVDAANYILDNLDKVEERKGKNLYKVSLHKGKSPGDYSWLEWDKSISKSDQAKINKQFESEGLAKSISDKGETDVAKKVGSDRDYNVSRPNPATKDGKSFYEGLVRYFLNIDGIKNPQKEASMFLLRAGIDGVKYPAESLSRGFTSETARGFNYVVFDENAVSIEEVIKFQKDADKARGAAMVAMDGSAIVYALTDANVSTPLHEMAHVYEHYLKPTERAAIVKAAGTEGWTTQTSEFFARGFEKYLSEGKAPSPALQQAFENFKKWLTDIYNGIVGSDIDIKLNAEMRSIYDNMLGGKVEGSVTYKESLDAIKKAMPKVKVVESSSIDGAGQVQGNTLTINPEYAGIDTPIHEAGHIFIDAVGGLKDKTIAKGIDQLRNTDLWKRVADEYPELSEEMLAKEVLAQAIGEEGAGIFETVEKQAKFRQVLNYIFDKLKQLLGIDKNIAKSLASQIISGIGTKQMSGTTAEVQQAKYSKKKKSPEQIVIEKTIEEMEASDDLSAYSVDDLVSFVNYIIAADFAQENVRTALVNRVRTRIALALKERGIAEAEKAGEKVDLRKAAAKDIGWYDKFGKILSHFDNMFPDMKEFSKIWNSAFFNKMKEGKAEKLTHNELASKVIQEYNKKMGILDRGKLAVGQVLGQQNHKYFSFLDKGNGKLISEKEARAKGFSKNQIDYIKYVRELIAKRQELAPEDPYNDEMDVLKLDKGFYEKFQTEGLVSALSNFVGTEDNLLNTRIEFVNPNTGKSQTASFGEIQVALQKYADKGLLEKAKAVGMLVKYGYKAKMQLKEDIDRGLVKKRGRGEYTLDDNGNLKSRFDTKRDENRSYSRDFYSAVNMYIDDTMHVKHISKVAQIANSLEYLAENGAINSQGEKIQESKKNLAQYMKMWTDLHVLQRPNENNPALDKILKGVRFLSSATTMWFNVPANILNVAIGNYNNWRDTDGKTWALGQKRLFGKGPRSVKSGAGLINKYAADIVDKYVAVTTDFDSNPVMTGRDALSKLAMLGQKWGEFQIQASGLLGLMDEKDYNSFEYKKNKYGVDELVVKEGVDEKELESKILALMDKVSDVQGKYSSKDRMNILNNEMGKIALQYRVWMPAWFRTRFNKETGSYNLGITRFLRDGCKQLRQDIANGNWEALSKNKVFAQNLKGLMTLGFLAALVYNDDEDEEKSMISKLYQRALSDVLFIFEPDNLKFTLSKPIAAMGAVDKLITIADHLFAIEEDDFYDKAGKYGDEGDSKLRGDIMGILPGRKVIDMLDDEE